MTATKTHKPNGSARAIFSHDKSSYAAASVASLGGTSLGSSYAQCACRLIDSANVLNLPRFRCSYGESIDVPRRDDENMREIGDVVGELARFECFRVVSISTRTEKKSLFLHLNRRYRRNFIVRLVHCRLYFQYVSTDSFSRE